MEKIMHRLMWKFVNNLKEAQANVQEASKIVLSDKADFKQSLTNLNLNKMIFIRNKLLGKEIQLFK